MSDFNWNNISRDLEVINLLEERRKIEEKVKALDEFALIKYEMEMLGIDQANEDSKQNEEALSIGSVSKRFEIDFDGNVLAGIEITNNEPKVFGAMNGWGNGISTDKCKITEKKD